MEEIRPGLMVIHGNRMEDLRALAIAWMGAHPLAPLENETILVQSNGVAQWLKLALAASPAEGGLGIAAALDVQLPSRFLWQAYRAVLGPGQVPKHSPYDKENLVWRLMRLLPGLLAEPDFAPLAAYLEGDGDMRKRHQLGERLADLLDQYQVYRADWLAAWAAGGDGLPGGREAGRAVPGEQSWQPRLWRALVADVGEEEGSRAGVHERFLRLAADLNGRPAGLPRRLTVFGLSSLPAQSLEALAVLGRFCQVMVFVLNPCRHYWADIVPDRDLLRAARQRQPRKAHMPSNLTDEALHLHAHPLLAAWGRQGRDYSRLLDEYDDPASYRSAFLGSQLPENLRKLDMFAKPDTGRLLGQLQEDILELRPLSDPERARAPVAAGDDSLRFHRAHSPLREVEILHDQLLARFDADPGLKPRDVIVMVPDIERYAPFVAAVFGQYGREDWRHIPHTLADRRGRGREPLLSALEFILAAPENRFPASEVLDLLDVPAVRKRFGLGESDLPTLHRWVRQAGVRWGLSARQRAGLGLPEGLEQNTWHFGLSRMLLGYAAGDGEAWLGVEPFPEIGGLDAAVLGPLALFLERLEAAWSGLSRPVPPEEWGARLLALLGDFFLAATESDSLTLARLEKRLVEWQDACLAAGLTEPLPLAVVREAWLSGMDAGGLSQRFMGGAVNFCTLMPMRAIPFRVVCLLGMNDGDYPRAQPASDFDLMARDYRPGDRSRREDDRYLFLEALLSARDQFYVSWVGRNARDNSERPPSVLLGQLRDHLAAGWRFSGGGDLLAALTTEHFLQPFHGAYFSDEDARHFSYASEWLASGDVESREGTPVAGRLDVPEPLPALTVASLAGFLKNPVKAFFNRRLGVWFGDEAEALRDTEPFDLNRLEGSGLADALLAAALPFAGEDGAVRQALERAGERLKRSGALPLAGMGEVCLGQLREPLPGMLARYGQVRASWPVLIAEPARLEFSHGEMALADWLGGLRAEAGADGGGGPVLRLLPLVRPLYKDKSPQWKQFIGPWAAHVVANAAGLAMSTLLVGTDRNVLLSPLEQAAAGKILCRLMDAWLEGLRRPLPLSLGAGFACLEKGEWNARKVYEGTDYDKSPGEVAWCPYLRRQYPDFAALAVSGEFPGWAEALYGPLVAAIQAAEEAA